MDQLLHFEADMMSWELVKLVAFALDIAGFKDVFHGESGPGGGHPYVGCKVPREQVERLREVLTKCFKHFDYEEDFLLVVEGDQIIME